MNFTPAEPANFADYAYTCPANDGADAFTPEECAILLSIADKGTPRPGTTAVEGNVTPDIRDVEVVDVSPSLSGVFAGKLLLLASSVNAFWWNFDITTLDNIEVLRYGPGGHYDEHIDRFGGHQTRKLTSITFLSDPADYEGGDLILRTTSGFVTSPKDQGTTIFFPSWVPHQVLPVTSGERRIASAWFRGPAFR
jgi:PKHD-type hydroxylase